MELRERIERYRRIEQSRERPLIVYATSTRAGAEGQMGADAVREFIDQIDSIPVGTTSVDVLIHSTGGDALAAWKLMSILRERFTTVGVLVPYMAFSAATIFALGADEIVMHPHASLGPIDPQITIRLKDGARRRFSFEDVGAFLRFMKDEVGLTEQPHITAILEELIKVVDPVHVGGAKRASELSTDVGERLLQMHMTGPEDRAKARSIAEGLNKTFFAHGDAVSRSRARALNLKLAPSNPQFEALIWAAYLAIENYLLCRERFDPIQYFLANGGAASVAPTAGVRLPANTPAQVAQQVWQQIGQVAINAAANPAVEVPYDQKIAVIESIRVASEFQVTGSLVGARLPGGEVQVVATPTKAGWVTVPIPPAAPAGGENQANLAPQGAA